jgi:8-hydroxy-5-deazaflavin:NADPH oxidoreductase
VNIAKEWKGSKMKIAVMGTGRIGTAIGGGWKAAGHMVVYGSRKPLGTGQFGLKAAADQAEVIAIATPWDAVPDLCKAIGPQNSKLIIDCSNPVVMGSGAPTDKAGHVLSGAEQVQQWRPEAHVFKSLNQTGFENLANATKYASRPLMLVTGDHAPGKATVMSLVSDLGLEAVDAGQLANSDKLEHLARLWIDLAFKRGLGRGFAFTLNKR